MRTQYDAGRYPSGTTNEQKSRMNTWITYTKNFISGNSQQSKDFDTEEKSHEEKFIKKGIEIIIIY